LALEEATSSLSDEVPAGAEMEEDISSITEQAQTDAINKDDEQIKQARKENEARGKEQPEKEPVRKEMKEAKKREKERKNQEIKDEQLKCANECLCVTPQSNTILMRAFHCFLAAHSCKSKCQGMQSQRVLPHGSF
jgi:hypothetical protein